MRVGAELDGRYRVLEKLGEGGMGEVYLAEHLQLGRKEALKVLLPAVARTPALAARFRREARAINRLAHPHIVGVYDFGRLPDGRFYLAMEYAEGDSLRELLGRGGRLSLHKTLLLLGQLADAMDHAHARNVVHRDLKPENIVVTQRPGVSDVLKVLDFGLAKITAPDYTESLAPTTTGSTFGTPSYMSPEQITGEDIDGRSDIYACGCIAFELVTGAPPFSGRAMEICHKHVEQAAPSPNDVRPDHPIPPQLESIIARCLEKDPALRFQSGSAVLDALRQVPGFGERASSGRLRRAGSDVALSEAKTEFEERTEPALTRLPPQALRELARDELSAAARDAGEAMLDAGCTNVDLMFELTRLRDVLADLERWDAELLEVERRRAQVQQRSREREARLRFALGELRFERVEAGSSNPELERRVTELGGRLAAAAHERQTQLAALHDREMTVSSNRGATSDELAEISTVVEPLVCNLAASYTSAPSVQPALGRLEAARAAFERYGAEAQRE